MTTIDGLKSCMEYLVVPIFISLLFIKLNSIITKIFSILWSHCKSIMNQMNNVPRIDSLIFSATGQAMVRMCMNSIFATGGINPIKLPDRVLFLFQVHVLQFGSFGCRALRHSSTVSLNLE